MVGWRRDRYSGGAVSEPAPREPRCHTSAAEPTGYFAIDEASSTREISTDDSVNIHRVLMAAAPNSQIAGQIRLARNWIGGNNYNPCGATYVDSPPDEVPRLLEIFGSRSQRNTCRHWCKRHSSMSQFETIHPCLDGNGQTGRALTHVILRRSGLAPAHVPPISVVPAANRSRYIGGLHSFPR